MLQPHSLKIERYFRREILILVLNIFVELNAYYIQVCLSCKSSSANTAFERLVSYMNWCHMSRSQLSFLCKACITNITIERLFFSWTDSLWTDASSRSRWKVWTVQWQKCYWRSFMILMSHVGSTLKTFYFKQKLKHFEKLLFYQQNWSFYWTGEETNENLSFSNTYN